MSETRDPVRLGVVGLGFMGGTHATNARDLGHEVVAGADLAADAREAFVDEFDATTYADFGDMYANEALDAVAVSTPNAVHEPAAVGALERDVAVLCEKPLAHTLESAERIAAAAEGSAGFCAVNFHNRFSAGAETFKGYQRAGEIGEVSHVQANYVRSRGVPGVGSWFTNEEVSGGGAVIDIGVHAIDFALYLMDFPTVEEVSAVTRTQFGDRDEYVDPGDWYEADDQEIFDVEDAATAMIRCADDRTVTLEVAWAANQTATKEFVVRGADAGARLDLGGDDLSLFEAHDYGTDHLVESEVSEASLDHSGWAGSDEQFLTAVASGDPPAYNTVKQALTVQRVIDAIYRSADAGTAVSVE